jgi:hypothetical protein
MKTTDWAVEITRVRNGYVCTYPDSNAYDETRFETQIFSDDDADELKSGEDLLWWIIAHFALSGSRYDTERLTITREPGDKYEPPALDEKEKA